MTWKRWLVYGLIMLVCDTAAWLLLDIQSVSLSGTVAAILFGISGAVWYDALRKMK